MSNDDTVIKLLTAKIKHLESHNRYLLDLATEWMNAHDKLKAKYEPESLVTSEQIDDLN